MHLQENTLFDLWHSSWEQGHMKYCPVVFTSCDLCSYKIWSCYVLRFRRRFICKKIHYLTFDVDIKVTWNVAQDPLHHVTREAEKIETATSNGLEDILTRKYIIWRLHEMLPSTIYIMWRIQVQSLKLLCLTIQEEMHLQENTLSDRWPWPRYWDQGQMKYCPVPSTSCDLCSCKIWSC